MHMSRVMTRKQPPYPTRGASISLLYPATAMRSSALGASSRTSRQPGTATPCGPMSSGFEGGGTGAAAPQFTAAAASDLLLFDLG